jgi:cytoskeletal protein RodZ
MEGIGDRLRKRREEIGFSLEDVAEVTKFRPETIGAVEEGRAGVFPAEAYFDAFLRAYARVLGLDPREIVRDLKSEEERAQEAIRGIRFRPARRWGLRRILIWVGATIGVAVVVFTLFDRVFDGTTMLADKAGLTQESAAQHEGAGEESMAMAVPGLVPVVDTTEFQSEEPSSAGDVSEVEEFAPAPVIPEPGPTGQVEQEEQKQISETESHMFRLSIDALKGVQLTLACGDSLLFDGYLTGGDSKTFESEEPFVIVSLSDRHAVSFRLDGREVRLPQSAGEQVYDLALPVDGQGQ